MQFNRYTFFSNRTYDDDLNKDINTVDKPKNFTSIIKSCGFVRADGSEIDPSVPVEDFRWKYDKDENAACWNKSTYDYDHMCYFQFRPRGLNSRSYLNHFFYSLYGASYNSSHSFFFIPLKNNGFIMESYPITAWYGYYNPNPKLMSITDQNSIPPSYVYNWEQWSVVHNALCFYNNVTNNYWYVISNAIHGYWAYYDGNEKEDYPGESARPATLYNQDTSMSVLNDYRDIYRNKTDYKQNICTLIKAPCSDGFLSNLYIVSTSPAPERRYYYPGASGYYVGYHNWIGTDNRFFSFNGRNFYGFMNNLAVELPSD